MTDIDIDDMVKAGFRCPMCESKEIRGCYHEHQIMGSYICERCGIRWKEDQDERGIWKDIAEKYKGEQFRVETKIAAKELVKKLTKNRKNHPYEEGMYAGIPAGGFVWTLHKVGQVVPVLDSRSSDEVDFKHFGHDDRIRMPRRKKSN